jgi:hypothetical protein
VAATEVESIAFRVLENLAESEPLTLGELRAQVETELAIAAPNRRTITSIGNSLHGALLKDAALGPARARVYDPEWLNDVAGRQILSTQLLDTVPAEACTSANERSCPRNWNADLFVRRGVLGAIFDDFLRQPQTLLALVAPSEYGKSWMMAHWAQVRLAGQIRLLVNARELPASLQLSAIVAEILTSPELGDSPNEGVLRKLTAAAAFTPVLLIDGLIPNAGVDALRDDIDRLVSDCSAAGWKLVISCSEPLWRILHMADRLLPVDVYDSPGNLPDGGIGGTSTGLQPLSDDELREFLYRRLDSRCAESVWHRLRDERFWPLRGPYLLERYVEQYGPQLCSSEEMPTPDVDSLLESHLANLLTRVTRRHLLAPSDIGPAIDALTDAIQRARPAGLAYSDARALLDHYFGHLAPAIISDPRQEGLLTGDGPIEFAEEALVACLLCADSDFHSTDSVKLCRHSRRSTMRVWSLRPLLGLARPPL